MKLKFYHIITIGCQMNKADSERLAAFLEKNGLKDKNNFKEADLVIINTCGVRQSAENRAYALVNQIKEANPTATITITGCLSKREDVQERLAGCVDLFFPASAMTDILKLLEKRILKSSLSLDEVRLMQGEKYLTILPKYQNNFSALVPIGNGCNNFCSYCVVPYARGREVYRPAASIIKEVRELIAKGFKEIILIAQNVNSYQSGAYDFPKLLVQLATIKGDFWLRFSTSHPKDVSEQLIDAISSQLKICPHLHLAVQSGDDDILKAMNRKYTAAHFLSRVKKLRQARPGIAITTDVIVGFPGETKKQFNNSVKLFKQAAFDMAYISRYSPRPGTASARLEDNVSLEEKKRREKVIDAVLRETAAANNSAYEGQTVRILIEGINKRGHYYGKTGSYKNVSISGDYQAQPSLIGRFAAVKITKCQPFGLDGDLV